LYEDKQRGANVHMIIFCKPEGERPFAICRWRW